MRLVFTSDAVGVAIRSVELYGIVKTAFWFRLRFHRLRSSENWVVGVASRSGRTKPSVGTCIVTGPSFLVLPLLLPTPIPSPLWLRLRHPFLMFRRSYALLRLRVWLQSRLRCQWIHFFVQCILEGCYANGERGAGNEHRERENEKLETKPNLKPSSISNFILFPVFILPFTLLVPRSPFPVPPFSNIHASQSLDRKNTTDFVFRSKRELNVYYLVLKRL